MKVAVIGAGYWGANLVRVFHQLGALNLVCDFDEARFTELAVSYPGIQFGHSLETALDDRNIDGVVIATPADSHYAIAKKALAAGKDVYVEKPLTLRCGEAEDLISAAERYGRILMVGHLLEFHPAITRLKALIDSGELGRIEYIYSNRLNLGKVRREENALWSFAPHDISVILLLLNRFPIQVTATGGTYLQPNIADVTISTLLFDRGVRAHLFVSWLHPYKEQKLIVIGERAMAVFDDVRKTDKLQLYDKKIEFINGSFHVERPNATTILYPADEPLLLEARHFLDCMRTRAVPKTDGLDGWRVLKVLEGCQRSMSMNGEPVPVDGVRSMDVVHS